MLPINVTSMHWSIALCPNRVPTVYQLCPKSLLRTNCEQAVLRFFLKCVPLCPECDQLDYQDAKMWPEPFFSSYEIFILELY